MQGGKRQGAGRPQGARNKATIAAYELLGGELEVITRAAIDEAKTGNMAAIKLCLDRVLPSIKTAPMQPVDLPELKTAADVPAFFLRLNELLKNGELSLDELNGLTSLVTAFTRSIDIAELEHRITVLETI